MAQKTLTALMLMSVRGLLINCTLVADGLRSTEFVHVYVPVLHIFPMHA